MARAALTHPHRKLRADGGPEVPVLLYVLYLNCAGRRRRKVCRVWKSSLPRLPPQDARRLFPPLGGNPICRFMGKSLRPLSHADHRCLITLPGDFLCGPSTLAELCGAVFSCLLVCLFWKSGASPPSRRTENGQVIIITHCHKTAPSRFPSLVTHMLARHDVQ